MAGIEVVGLVLGAVPLLISGMEHYGEGVRTIKRMRNAADEFATLKTILDAERAIFQNDLEFLLQDDIDHHVLPRLLQDVHDPYWSDPSLGECLKRRLGRNYNVYFASVKAMDSTIKELMDCLKLNSKDGKGPFDQRDKKSVAHVLGKIKFGLRMKKYVELVEVISANNRRLNLLTAQTGTLAPIREVRRRAPDFEKTRQYAFSLFGVLQNRFVGSCTLSHRASLHMKPLGHVQKLVEEPPDSKRLRIIFHHQSPPTTPAGLSWTIKEAEIEALDEDASSDDEPTFGSVRPNVRFAVRTAPTPGPQPPRSLQEIHDLCASLHLLHATTTTQPDCDQCFGYLSAAPHSPHRHGLYHPRNPVLRAPTAMPTSLRLAQVLDGAVHLGETDKKFLAVALASGMLHLHNTPWLAEQWGKHEIIVFQRGNGLIASHPFISADISSNSAFPPTTAPIEYFRPCRLIKERTVFALGILLIELALGSSFETLIASEDCNSDGSKHELTDFLAADRLVEKVYHVAGERYGNAVRRCIRCDFDHKESSLWDAEFRRKVYDGVVAELQLDVNDILYL